MARERGGYKKKLASREKKEKKKGVRIHWYMGANWVGQRESDTV